MSHGIHHVTAIASDPQRNLDFYAGTLGLRLVKRTVNFDDPGTYHFYFGDRLGRPGTLLTFFPWPGIRPGTRGNGQADTTSFRVPAGSLEFWLDRLATQDVDFDMPVRRFGDEVLALRDPDGLALELVARDGAAEIEPWAESGIPSERAILGFDGVALAVAATAPTERLLVERLGFRREAEAHGRVRLVAGADGPGARVDLVAHPGAARGRLGAGSVHHVAFRAAGDAEQAEIGATLVADGLGVTPVQDRQYFRSIYFQEPGGVLFEIATDGPGFARDETPERLGTTLRLPPWLEAQRARIERALPEVRTIRAGAPA